MLLGTKSLIWDLDFIYSLMPLRNCPTCTTTSEIYDINMHICLWCDYLYKHVNAHGGQKEYIKRGLK